jgi:trans-aconitate methyltransferase
MNTVNAFWRWYAAVYDLIWDSDSVAAVYESLLDELPQSGVAVDLGCGTGLSRAALVERNWRVPPSSLKRNIPG